LQSSVEIGDARCHRDLAHSFDAIDAAFRGFVGVPAFEPSARSRVDVRISPESDDYVNVV
jgi:hypothetical protein